ncbi:MAG: adenosylcobinamide-GDP ribazoletransferase [Candidatus Omnitrophica bacterium]|nr:adenosylcobinamide-GDP ribazoletransferase [Candidatus Omnitrophota bacterium]
MITAFLSAVQFLTVVPLKIKDTGEKRMAGSLVYFPLVGLLIGLSLAGINNLLFFLNFNIFAISIITVVALIVITGGLHLDGLCDTADAFLSSKPKEEMLNIMRDPHTGVMGILSLISIILLKISFLSSINIPLRPTALVLMCVLSRWSAVWTMFLFPYARQEGKAKVFIQGMNLKIFMLSSIAALILAFVIWGLRGLLALFIIAACSYLSGKIITRRIGGLTGDTLGANIELTEIIVLLIVCIG